MKTNMETVNDILRVRNGKPEKKSFQSIIYNLIKDENNIDIKVKINKEFFIMTSITISVRKEHPLHSISSWTIQACELIPSSTCRNIENFLKSEGFVKTCGTWTPAHTCEFFPFK